MEPPEKKSPSLEKEGDSPGDMRRKKKEKEKKCFRSPGTPDINMPLHSFHPHFGVNYIILLGTRLMRRERQHSLIYQIKKRKKKKDISEKPSLDVPDLIRTIACLESRGLLVVKKSLPTEGHMAVLRIDYYQRKWRCHELFDAASSGLYKKSPVSKKKSWNTIKSEYIEIGVGPPTEAGGWKIFLFSSGHASGSPDGHSTTNISIIHGNETW